MNRVQLVQVIVIIVAAILGYQVVFSFALFLVSAVSSILNRNGLDSSLTVTYGAMALLYAISMFLLLNNTPKLSKWLAEKIHLDEEVQIGFTDVSVLFGVILFLTLSTLLKNLPAVLYQAFHLFILNAGGFSNSSGLIEDPYGRANYPQWIETVAAIILLFNIKPVVRYLQNKINPEDPHAIETEEDSSETNP